MTQSYIINSPKELLTYYLIKPNWISPFSLLLLLLFYFIFFYLWTDDGSSFSSVRSGCSVWLTLHTCSIDTSLISPPNQANSTEKRYYHTCTPLIKELLIWKKEKKITKLSKKLLIPFFILIGSRFFASVERRPLVFPFSFSFLMRRNSEIVI